MKSISGAEATGWGRGNCLNRFPTKPGQSGWGAEDISCSQPMQCLRLSRWGGGGAGGGGELFAAPTPDAVFPLPAGGGGAKRDKRKHCIGWLQEISSAPHPD